MHSLRHLPRPIALAAALVLALALLTAAGCGGGSKKSSKTTAATTPANTTTTATQTTPKPPAKHTKTTSTTPGSSTSTTPSGGGSSGGATAPATISRAEFVKRADGICRATQKRLLRAVKPNPRQPPNVSTYTRTVTAGFLAAANAVARLPKPSTGPSPDAYVAAEKHKMRLLTQLGKALAGRNAQELQRIARQAQRAAVVSRRLARAQGFKVCGSV